MLYLLLSLNRFRVQAFVQLCVGLHRVLWWGLYGACCFIGLFWAQQKYKAEAGWFVQADAKDEDNKGGC